MAHQAPVRSSPSKRFCCSFSRGDDILILPRHARRGVKKPLNPILGETFTCYWDYPDGTRGYYVSEQTSHHPPKSSYFFMAPEHHIRIDGTLKPRSKFLGNSAASMMEGIAILRLLNRGQDKEKGER